MKPPKTPLNLGWDAAAPGSSMTVVEISSLSVKPQSRRPQRPFTQRVGPPRLIRLTLLPVLLAATLMAVPALQSQSAAPEPGAGGPPADSSFVIPHSSLPPAIDPGVFQPFVDGLLGKYGWLTTILLAIGSLRILFKPVMLVVENTVKNDPVKLAEVQKFEAGPIYKTIATVLDVGASIKLPLVKPPGPPAP